MHSSMFNDLPSERGCLAVFAVVAVVLVLAGGGLALLARWLFF